MKSSRQKFSFYSSSSSTVTYTFQNDHTTPPLQTQTKVIPIKSPITDTATAAVKLQSVYRAHLIRALYKKISAVNSEATQLQHLLQRQETVDSIRSNERERLRMNEALMTLLLRLDSVPGVDPSLRELRRKVSHRIVGLQEILDAVSAAKVDVWEEDGCGFMKNWDEEVARMEAEICRETGGEEMERFCAEHLGFRCLQRFLREP